MKTETERFIELNRELESRVVRSELNKDLTCEYEITIPEDIMTQYIAPRGMENVIDTGKMNNNKSWRGMECCWN